VAPGLLSPYGMGAVDERDRRAAHRAGGKARTAPAWRQETRAADRARRTPVDPVLVVDDDAICCELMAMALERDGHRVEWTTDPVHALALVRGRRYALLVSDVNMPRMSGTALAGEVARCRPGLRTLLVTGVADARVRAEAEALGTVLLAKPVRVEVLCSAVRELVRGHADRRAAR
jgi:DNA-binding NtrC family response regulator